MLAAKGRAGPDGASLARFPGEVWQVPAAKFLVERQLAIKAKSSATLPENLRNVKRAAP